MKARPDGPTPVEQYKWLLDVVPTILGWLGGALGIVVVSWRWVRRALRAVRLSDAFHTHFGDRTVEDLKAFVDTMRRCHTESEIRHRLAENYLCIGVYICDANGLCTWANEYLLETFGVDVDSLKGNGWVAALHPSDRERSYKAWMYCVKHRLPYDERYTMINQRTNEVHKIRTRAYSVLDAQGEVECYVGYVVEEEREEQLP